MKYFRLYGDLNHELLEKFMSFMEQDGEKTIYITSHGGDIDIALTILDILEQQQDYVTLVIGEYIASAALELVLRFKGKKRILSTTLVGFHYTSADLSISKFKDPFSFASILQSEIEKENKELLDLNSSFFTEEEIAEIEKGGIVYLNSKRSKDMLEGTPFVSLPLNFD